MVDKTKRRTTDKEKRDNNENSVYDKKLFADPEEMEKGINRIMGIDEE